MMNNKSDTQAIQETEAAIRAAALDYAEGWYEGRC